MASVRRHTWKGSSAFQVSWYDQNGERHRKQFRLRRDADAFRVEIEDQLRKGSYRHQADKMTVGDLASVWIENCRARNRRQERMTHGTLVCYESHIRNYICCEKLRSVNPFLKLRQARPFDKGLSKNKLGKVTSAVVGKFRDNLRDAGVGVTTTRDILATLHNMFQYARSQDFITNNPVSSIRVFGTRNERAKKIVPPSKWLINTLMNNADELFRLKIYVAASTGIRAGEFHALRWKHLDELRKNADHKYACRQMGR